MSLGRYSPFLLLVVLGCQASAEPLDNDVVRAAPPPRCGDGYLHVGEECDDGNLSNEDHCSYRCIVIPISCGDGKLDWPLEQCDDGNGKDDDDCSIECLVRTRT